MQFLVKKIAQLRFGWNERALTESDFYRICGRFGIKVTEMPLRTNGFYYRVLGQDFIAVDSKLDGPSKLLVLFHELGHFLFHTPDSGSTANFHGVGGSSRKEREADVFALCAVIPTSSIVDGKYLELADDHRIGPSIVEDRIAIFKKYGF